MVQQATTRKEPDGDGGVEYRVTGPPGCGKTTYLGEQVRGAVEAGRRPMVVSLTRTAAAEVSGRALPLESKAVGTLHSMCYRAIGNPEIAEARKNLEDWNERYPAYELTLGGSRDRDGDEDVVEPPAHNEKGDALMNAYQTFRARMVPDLPDDIRAFAREWNAWKRENGLMDFCELIETCLRDVPQAVENPDVLFVDEAQDMSPLEMALIRKWGHAAGRLVIVGDPDQAIYTWRGADPESFTNPRLPEQQTRTLMQSYRLPREVHQRAMRWINRSPRREGVPYRPRDQEGEVRQIGASYGYPEGVIRDAERYLDAGKSIMLLTSCAYMLQPMTDFLRQSGIPFHNPHRRTNGAWNPLLRRRNTVSAADRLLAFLHLGERGSWSAEDLRRWTTAVRVRGTFQKDGKKRLQDLEDQEPGEAGWDDIRNLLTDEAIEAGLTADLDWYQQQLTASRRQASEFPVNIARRHQSGDKLRETPQITVGTVHSAKGAEVDVVYLFPDLSHPGNMEWKGNNRQKAAVYRTYYVGMTRARESLILCNPVNHRAAVDF